MDILAAIKSEERKLEEQIGKLQHQLVGLRAASKALIGSAGIKATTAKKRVMPEAARAKIAAAARQRWAKMRADTSAGRPTTTVKKRVLSAAGRAKIAAAAKRRWAKVKAQSKKVTA
jgi:hypothetical protein